MIGKAAALWLIAGPIPLAPASPGFETIAIRPQLGDLNWAKGVVPTPRGDLSVAWKLGEEKFLLDLDIPGGRATVTLPTERFDGAAVFVDGKQAAQVVEVAAGKHHLEVTGNIKLTPASK